MADDATLAMLFGQAGGAALRSILDSDDLHGQASIAAAMFDELDHPTGHEISGVLRKDPEAGFLLLRRLGGGSSVYNAIQAKQKAQREAMGAEAARNAVVTQGRIYLEGPQAGDPSLAQTLEAAAAGGADLGPVLDDLKKVQGLKAPGSLDRMGELLKGAGVDPDNYTGETVRAFAEDLDAKAQPNYAGPDRLPRWELLKRRPEQAAPRQPPSGYFFTQDDEGNQVLEAYPGGPGYDESLKNRRARLLARGKPVPPELDAAIASLQTPRAPLGEARKAIDKYLALVSQGVEEKDIPPNVRRAFEQAVRSNPLNNLMGRALEGIDLTGAPDDARRAKVIEELTIENGVTPSEEQIQQRLRGF